MKSIRRLLALLASDPKMHPTIANTVIAMMNIQSSGDSAINAASERNSKLFIGYIIILLVTGIIVAIFTYLTWDSGNKLQEAIRKDADARIAEASRGVTKLEGENLRLGGDLELEKGKVAVLQKDASNAKAAQQEVEIKLAEQQERTAKAEKGLLEVSKRQEPRNLYAMDAGKFNEFLKGKPKSPVTISCVEGNQEGCTFAKQIKNALIANGWEVSGVFPRALEGSPSGISLHVASASKTMPTLPETIPIGAYILNDLFHTVLGIELDRRFPIMMGLPPGHVELFVGYQ